MIPLGVLASARHAAGGGGGPLAKTFLSTATNAANASSYTITGAALGTASADRSIVVVAAIRSASANTITACTIAGVSATIDYQVVGTYSTPVTIAFCRALIPSGATGNIVVTCNVAAARLMAGWWALTGATPVLLDSDQYEGGPTTLSLTDADGGVALAAVVDGDEVSITGTVTTDATTAVVEGHAGTVASSLTDGTGTAVTTDTTMFGAWLNAAITYQPS